ncbi:hypothetical protein [Listeria newyorkensis]|uniref:hypothetical protein n=1 Tax=Listeria newyorkensis TaxID=1497681 RepID=UPI00148525F9|nr:hypothetical protein [Listeria newyorkensis]
MVKKIIQTILLCIPIALAIGFISVKFFFMKKTLAETGIFWWQISVVVIITLVITIGFSFGLWHLYKWNRRYFYLALAVLVILPRLTWILCFKTEPTSDFYLYHLIASYRADGNDWSTLYKQNLLNYAPFFTHILYFSTVLSWVYSFTGNSAIAGQLFNIVLTFIGALFFFKACYQIFKLPIAVIATTIFNLWPSYLMYSTLIGTEPLFMCLFAISLYIWVRLNESKPGIFLSIFFALTLIAMNFISPLAAVILIACILTSLIVKWEWRSFWRKYLPVLALCMLLFVGATFVNKILYPFPTASNFTGYSLYVGSNEKTAGQWSKNDMAYFWSLYKKDTPDLEKINTAMAKKGEERLRNIIAEGHLAAFIGDKLKLYGDESYGYQWNVYNNAPQLYHYSTFLLMVSNIVASLMLLLTVAGFIIAIIRQKMKQVYIFALMEVGFTISGMLVEVQGRYHVPLLFVYSVLASFALWHLIEWIPKRRKRSLSH